MFDSELAACERRQEIDLDPGQEVVVFPLEPVMRLLLNDDNDVSRCYSGCLITLATESDRLAALHALIDMDLKHLLLRDDLLADTGLAAVLVVDDLATALTFVTGLLDLLNHRAHLAHHDTNTATATTVALPHSALLATLAVALGADDVAGECELGNLALVQVFQRNSNTVNKVLGLPWPLRSATATEKSAAAKELAEQVLEKQR